MSNQFLSEKEAIELVIDLATKEGAQAEVIVDSSHNFSLKAQKGALSEVSASSSQVLGLRLMLDNRAAVTSSESFERESLKAMVRDALALARLSKSAEENSLMALGETTRWNSELTAPTDSASLEDKSALALKLETEICKMEGVKAAPYNGYSESLHNREIANSHGLQVSYQESAKGCFTSALIERNSDQAMSYFSSSSRLFNELNPDLCIIESYRRADALIDAQGVQTGKYDVIFETNILQSFWGTFSNIFSAKTTVSGLNPFSDKLGNLVAAKNLTISDRPLMDGGLRTQYFDDEGAPCSDITLIEKGVFKSYLHNHQTAQKLGMTNNHRASRSPKSHLSVGHTHFCISAGESGHNDILSGDNLLVITSIQGLGSGSSDISGDFSCGVSGFVYSKGEIVRAFKGVTLSGNWWEMLKSQIAMVGDEVEISSSKSFFSPLIRWSDLQIAGK